MSDKNIFALQSWYYIYTSLMFTAFSLISEAENVIILNRCMNFAFRSMLYEEGKRDFRFAIELFLTAYLQEIRQLILID